MAIFRQSAGYVFILSRFLLPPYEVTTTSSQRFVHSFMQSRLNYVRDIVFPLIGARFSSFSWEFLVICDLHQSQKWLSQFVFDFSSLKFIEISSSECVTLTEYDLRAAIRSINGIYRISKSSNISAFNELNFFLVLLRLQIYEAIAGIFWQSTSYVLKSVFPRIYWGL